MQRFFQIALILAALLGLSVVRDGAAQQTEQPAAQPPVDTAAIQAIKESNPTTVADLVRAALVTADLDRTDLSKAYLQKLIDNDPTGEEVWSAQRKLGSAQFVRLQTLDTIQPEGGKASTLLLDKLQAYLHDPTRLKMAVDQLASSDITAKSKAARQLIDAGTTAANPLFAVLADPARKAEYPAVKKVLVHFGRVMHPPVLAALDSDDPHLVAELADVARQMQLKSAMPFLVGSFVTTDNAELKEAIGLYLDDVVAHRPDTAEAKAYLAKRVNAYLDGAPMFPLNAEGEVDLWSWNPDSKQVEVHQLPATDANVVVAGQLLHDLYAIDGDNPEVQMLSTLAAMQRIGVLQESDELLKQLVATHGIEVVEAALKRSLEGRKYAHASVIACEQLGATKNADLLLAVDGNLSQLARALQSPVYRVRRAAAKAILEIDPKTPYAGSAELLDALGFMANSQGKRLIVIGELQQQRAQEMGSLLAELRLEPMVTAGGAELFKAAYSSPDVEAIFISKPLARPSVMETVQVLRKDRRTGDLPIGLISPIEEVIQFETRTENDPLTHVMIRPNDTEGFIFQLQHLYRSQGRLLVSAEEREADAEFAVSQITRMLDSEEDYNYYNFLKLEEIAIRRLVDDSVALDVAKLLGKLATPAAQVALIDYASDPFHPLAIRQASVEALKDAISRRGILLSKDQIITQYDRYNASEKLDSDTQAVLGQILDIIEAPTQDVRFDQPAKIGP
ncbi:hypothetical protein [Bremerella cremea]|uniref:hypothetical protein n=1 Tax=Bremerella cremea TaxID=1031537 RepID=UPI0031E856CD